MSRLATVMSFVIVPTLATALHAQPSTFPATDDGAPATMQAERTPTSAPVTLATQQSDAPTTAPAALASAGTTAPTTSPTTGPSASSEDAERAARMKALVAAAATRAAAATAPTFVTTPAKAVPETFAVLRSRSIFLKGRPISSNSSSSATRETPRRPEDTVVFNGVTDADGEVVAFVEDLSAGKVSRVRVGEQIARGKVVRITLDRLDYESGGKVTSVEIGQTLSGQAPPTGIASTQSTTSTPLSDDPNDIVSKMRRARMEGR